LYVSIARKKAEAGEGLIISRPEALASSDASNTGAQSPDPETEQPEDQPGDEGARASE
jgi:hypothetical protein